MPRPLLVLNLYPDFYAVAEGEHHPVVKINRWVIHKPVEELLVKIHWQLPRLTMSRKKIGENVMLDFLPLPLFLKLPIQLSKAAYRAAYLSYFLR